MAEYRNKGRALKGYRELKPMLTPDNRKIFHLLRNHKDEGIELDEEVDFRDNVDFLLKFYSILEIAIIADYVHPSLNPKLYKEINLVLKHAAVRMYYEKHYPLLLPQILVKNKEGEYLEESESSFSWKKIALFNDFLINIKSVEGDREVEQFQWFLDSGYTEDRGIDDLNELFSSKDSIRSYFMKRGSDKILGKAFWGYIKYVNFLMDYKALLDSIKEEPLLQSAIWHYQSYWFSQIKSKMSGVLTDSLKKIMKVVAETNVDMLKPTQTKEELTRDEYEGWKNESVNLLDGAIKDIETLVTAQLYDQPLKDHFNRF